MPLDVIFLIIVSVTVGSDAGMVHEENVEVNYTLTKLIKSDEFFNSTGFFNEFTNSTGFFNSSEYFNSTGFNYTDSDFQAFNSTGFYGFNSTGNYSYEANNTEHNSTDPWQTHTYYHETVVYNRLFYRQGYERQVPPPEVVTVTIGLEFIDLIEFNDQTQYGHMIVWEHQSWGDSRLSWNNTEYHVESLSLKPDLIWKPDITLYRNLVSGEAALNSNVVIHSDGGCMWIDVVERVIPCHYVVNDTIACTFRYGSWTHDGLRLNLTYEKSWTHEEYFDSAQFELVRVEMERNVKYYDCCPEPYIDITFTATMIPK